MGGRCGIIGSCQSAASRDCKALLVTKTNKKSPVNAKGNARQRYMLEGSVRTQSKLTDPSTMISKASIYIEFYLHSPEGAFGLAQPYWLKIVNFLYPMSFSAPARGNPF